MLTEEGIKKEIYDSKDENLLEYVQKNFEENDSLDEKDMEVLEKLDNNTINLGLARMERIKEDNDLGWLKHVIPILLLIAAAAVSLLSNMILLNVDAGDNNKLKQLENFGLYIVNVGILFGIYKLINTIIRRSGRKKITANYFSIILKEMKEDKKNKINQDSKNGKKENEISKINKKSEIVIIHTRYH